MNLQIIRRITGYVLLLEAALMLFPVLTGIIYGESQWLAYIISAGICLLCGAILAVKKPKTAKFYLKEGCVATALSWIVLSVFGAVPFVITGEIPSFVDALFETASGFSTTGTTILDNVEAVSHTSLLWRSLSHWIGGMGVLVFIMAVVPLSGGGSNMNIMKAESPGPSVGKLVPRLKETARLLYVIYFALTVAEFIFLIAGKMPLFDAICTSIGTAGTGGFGVKNTSIGGYSPYIQWVVTVFMVLFGVNFNANYFIIMRQVKKALAIEEVRIYLGMIFAAIGVITINIISLYDSVSHAIRDASFQVASMVTSTGFSTTDYDKWPFLSKTIILLLMTVGACSGSTGGGTKVSRFVIMGKALARELHQYAHPKSVKKLRLDGSSLSDSTIRSTAMYFFAFFLVFVGSLLIVSLEEHDFLTNFAAVLAAINNIGPGMNLSGPTESFSFFNPVSKLVLIFDMLAGRLELFPILMLFNYKVWKKQ